MLAYLKRENRIRDRGGRNHLLMEMNEDELDNLGDNHPSYRFSY